MITDFEREILTRTDVAKAEGMGHPTVAWIVWTDATDGVQMGRVRWGYLAMNGAEARWSASPFPGAWVPVNESDILVVRHPEAMQ